MSVIASVQLPDQPSSGGIVYHPLGGNGLISPHSVYHCRIIAEGDASGGVLRCNIRPDIRFVSLVSLVIAGIDNDSADRDVDITVSETPDSRMEVKLNASYRPITGLGFDNLVSYSPAPFAISAGASSDPTSNPVVRVTTSNADGVDLTVYAHIFNFDKRARELVPLEQMTAVLTRGEAALS